MDITQLFKACVKTVRLRNKDLPAPDKNRILKKHPKDEFTVKSNDICKQITQLKNLLLENRAAYMRFAYHLKGSAQMSDEERDMIDSESEKILGLCTHLISEFRQECWKRKVAAQHADYMDAVLEILSNYLKTVYDIYNTQKEYRIRHELDTYKFLKLESNKKLIPVIPPREKFKLDSKEINGDDMDTGSEEPDSQSGSKNSSYMENGRVSSSERVALDEDIARRQLALEEEDISPEDIQMFESENKQLLNELKGLSEEVEQIEKNVVDIAKLQEIFTEKVELIEHSISHCY